MSHKVTLTFTEISHRLKSLHFPDVDWIVGISTGGIVPAAMLAHQIDNHPSALPLLDVIQGEGG